MAESTTKRPRSDEGKDRAAKKQKGQWRKAGRNTGPGAGKRTLETGDSGIFVTCDKGREKKSSAEMLDLLAQEYPDPTTTQAEDKESAADNDDIEAQIRKEVEDLQPSRSRARFQPVQLDIPCVSFIKVDKELDPVEIVHSICMDAYTNPEKKRSRWIKRITPVTSMRKVLGGGLEELSHAILKPHFHSGGPPKKYAIRPTIRNNTDWNRDDVIGLIAGIVGKDHKVDLKNYDALILVDIFQNICGMSVVGGDYEKLKRFNVAEMYNPTPKSQPPAESTRKAADIVKDQ